MAAPTDQTTMPESGPDRWRAERLVKEAEASGRNLFGRRELLSDFTKQVLGMVLEVETEEHVGGAKHASDGSHGNSHDGIRSGTMITRTFFPGKHGKPTQKLVRRLHYPTASALLVRLATFIGWGALGCVDLVSVNPIPQTRLRGAQVVRNLVTDTVQPPSSPR